MWPWAPWGASGRGVQKESQDLSFHWATWVRAEEAGLWGGRCQESGALWSGILSFSSGRRDEQGRGCH